MKHLSFIIVLMCASMTFYSCNSSGKSGSESSEERTVASEKVTSAESESAAEKASSSEKEAAFAQGSRTDNKKTGNESEPFDYLNKLVVADDIEIKYNAAITEVYNEKRTELPESDPFHYSDHGPGMNDVKVLKTKIAASGKEYFVVFSWGPSADPGFYFHETSNPAKSEFYLFGTKLYIPGNGSIYVSGHTNNMFDNRKKYQVRNNQLIEVEQPYYYVGLKSRMLKPAKLYKTEQLSKVIASLPENYSVEVLVNKPGTGLFLVKTDFGLTGWLEIGGENIFYGNELIEGIYYAGD